MNPLEMAIDDTPGCQVDIAECEVETVSDVADVPEVVDVPDFCDIIGNEHAKRALEVAAAGGHSVLMVGPPGMGKSMLRAALPGIIPAKYRGKYQASARESWTCECGYYGDTVHKCMCEVEDINRYRARRLSGQVDGIDMFLEVARLPVEKLMHRHRGECSADVRKRVEAAQCRQIERWGVLNAGLSPADVTRGCVLSDPCTALLTRACERVGFSGRAFYGVIKVTRTIADLDGSEAIEVPHLAEAIQYRAGWERLRG